MKLTYCSLQNFNFCIEKLRQQKVIAYPTESIFGLGCDPDSKSAVMELLALKQRPIEKGLILIAANYSQLIPYISDTKLTVSQRKKMLSNWPGPITYIVPSSLKIPWCAHHYESQAIRIIDHSDVQALCMAFGKPLVSTSANLFRGIPCRSITEIKQQFGIKFPVLHSITGGRLNPSEIRNVINDKLIRQG